MISALAGSVLGLLAVMVHTAFVLWMGRSEGRRFYLIFFGGFALRLILIATILTSVFLLTSLREVVFTFSFILSYLLWSVIEMIWFNSRWKSRGI